MSKKITSRNIEQFSDDDFYQDSKISMSNTRKQFDDSHWGYGRKITTKPKNKQNRQTKSTLSAA